MENKPYDDSNWKEEYKNFVSDKYKLGLLENYSNIKRSCEWINGTLLQNEHFINSSIDYRLRKGLKSQIISLYKQLYNNSSIY